MTIQNDIRTGMTDAFKGGHKETCDNLKYVLGEFKRLKGTKQGKEYIGDNLNDDQAARVINNIITEEIKLNKILNRESSDFLVLLNNYLPEKVCEEEIKSWIYNNIDFSKLNNKMQAIGIVKKHFGVTADGKVVANIIKNWG